MVGSELYVVRRRYAWYPGICIDYRLGFLYYCPDTIMPRNLTYKVFFFCIPMQIK